MQDKNLSIISKNTTGLLLLIGVCLVFAMQIIFALPVLTSIGVMGIISIIVLFLYRPLWGFLTLVIMRASVDFFSSYFSVTVGENISLNLASIFALLLIAASTLLIIIHRKTILHIPLLLPFSLIIIYTAFTYTYSIDRASTFQETLRLLSIFMSFAAAYILTIKIPKARLTIIATILLASVIPLSFALYQLVSGTGISDNTGTEGRLFGTFKHPNAFASFLMIIIAILTYRVFSKKITDTTNKNIAKILLFFTIAILLLTFSRGGWFALIIFFTIFSLLRAPKLLFLSFGLVVVMFFTSQTVHDRIEDIYNPPADSSIRWRFQQWKNAIAAWQLSPIYGYGAGTEIAIHEQQQGFYAGNPYTHNDFVKVLQETGVIGLILFVFLIGTTLTLLIKKYRHLDDDDLKLFVLVVILLFIAEIGFGMSSNIWRSTAVQWLLWTLIACALSINANQNKKQLL